MQPGQCSFPPPYAGICSQEPINDSSQIVPLVQNSKLFSLNSSTHSRGPTSVTAGPDARRGAAPVSPESIAEQLHRRLDLDAAAEDGIDFCPHLDTVHDRVTGNIVSGSPNCQGQVRMLPAAVCYNKGAAVSPARLVRGCTAAVCGAHTSCCEVYVTTETWHLEVKCVLVFGGQILSEQERAVMHGVFLQSGEFQHVREQMRMQRSLKGQEAQSKSPERARVG